MYKDTVTSYHCQSCNKQDIKWYGIAVSIFSIPLAKLQSSELNLNFDRMATS
jgi:hypothetical protein